MFLKLTQTCWGIPWGKVFSSLAELRSTIDSTIDGTRGPVAALLSIKLKTTMVFSKNTDHGLTRPGYPQSWNASPLPNSSKLPSMPCCQRQFECSQPQQAEANPVGINNPLGFSAFQKQLPIKSQHFFQTQPVKQAFWGLFRSCVFFTVLGEIF